MNAEEFLSRAAPYAIHGAASGVAWGVSLRVVQSSAAALRISCAIPVVSPALGFLGVGLASVVSNQVSRRIDHTLSTGDGPLSLPLEPRHLAIDFVLGATFFRALGTRFTSVLPSDVRFPGARARLSLPARGRQYASAVERAELQSMLRRDGCHHCGTRKGKVIGDHMPPNKSAHGGTTGEFGPTNWSNPEEVRAQAVRSLKELPLLGRLVPDYSPPPQRFYPQCEPCSMVQAQVMRTGKAGSALIVHRGRLRTSDLAGLVPSPLRYHMLGGHDLWDLKDLGVRARTARRNLAAQVRSNTLQLKRDLGIDLSALAKPMVEWLEQGSGGNSTSGLWPPWRGRG